MVNCAKSVVYKIMSLNPEVDDIYVGSTTAFRKRKHDHKTNCCNESAKYYNRSINSYVKMKDGGTGQW